MEFQYMILSRYHQSIDMFKYINILFDVPIIFWLIWFALNYNIVTQKSENELIFCIIMNTYDVLMSNVEWDRSPVSNE